MARVKLEMDGFRCERCGHEWIPADPNKEPLTCPNPKCRSPYWNRPRREPKEPNG